MKGIVHHRTGTLADKLLAGYLAMCALGSGLSCFLYILVPDGTVKFFGGTPSVTTNTWVPIVAAGDAIVSFLCVCALRGSGEVKRVVVLSVGWYFIFHVGGYLRGYLVNQQKPPFAMLVMYASMLGLGEAAALYWGIFRPPSSCGQQQQSAAYSGVPQDLEQKEQELQEPTSN